MAIIFLNFLFFFSPEWWKGEMKIKRWTCLHQLQSNKLTDLRLDFAAIKINFKMQVIFSYTKNL